MPRARASKPNQDTPAPRRRKAASTPKPEAQQPAPAPQPQPQPGNGNGHVKATSHTILEKSVCLTLWCHYLGNRRSVDLDPIEMREDGHAIDTDKEQLNLTKRIMDAKLLWPATKTIIQAKAYLKANAISAHRVFGERTYLIPVAAIERVDAQLAKYAERLRGDAESIAEAWDEAVERQKVLLKDMFRASDYITADQVRRAYAIEWFFVSFGAPDKLQTVNRAVYEAAVKKHERQLSEAWAEARLVVRQAALEVARKLLERLTPSTDGKKKAIRGDVLEQWTGFLDTYKVRDLTDDGGLSKVIEDLRKAANGADADQLRDDEALRARVAGQVGEAVARLGELVAETSGRGIALGGRV